ncbi:MAG TPA: NUDIX hydrolase [Candidatus Saccharimonadales bacterium]|nr:NUDIX hydrolase [Candidatus Saccharimonadales bacterium]
MNHTPHQKGPWQVVGSTPKYENHWISVREDQVIRPDGKTGIFGVVTMRPGISVLPVDDDGYVYLMQEYKYGTEKETIEVISGSGEPGEALHDTVRREMEEEAGLIAREITDLGYIDPFTSVVNSPNYLYLAEGLIEGMPEPEGTEHIQVLRVPYQQALDWVMDGTITHGASVAIILKVRDYLV